MNSLLSETAVCALKRIRTLRALTNKTGLQTTREQFDVLLALSNEDALAVADELKMAVSQ